MILFKASTDPTAVNVILSLSYYCKLIGKITEIKYFFIKLGLNSILTLQYSL